MASKSSFLPRLSFSRGDPPLLPLHQRSQRPLRTKTSEYDLADLSPRAEDALLSQEPDTTEEENSFAPKRRNHSVDFTDPHTSPESTPSKMKPRVLFAGPPPPIAKSTLLYRDVEDRGSSPSRARASSPASPRNTLTSVLFDRSPPNPKAYTSPAPTTDSTWRVLQRREKTLQKDLQTLLDIQAAGLSAGLGRPLDPSSGPASDAGSATGTATTTRSNRLPIERSSATGEVIPVRQPRPKKVGLRTARAGLARSMALLADLKAEEDASLATALGARKRALAQLRKLAARREGIAEELRSLEEDDEEPLAKELVGLGEEHTEICGEIGELEGRLARLRHRRRVIESRVQDVTNQRESGLSGYRGALREVEEQVTAMLVRPAVKPLDVEALKLVDEHGGEGVESNAEVPLGGTEFLRLRPERRTADMARDWWEGEVGIIEKRKAEVDKERAALEEGTEVWKEVIQLVSEFESDLRREMTGDDSSMGKGKSLPPTPEEKMRAQLTKMSGVITGLEQRMNIVETKSWNLLVCAIGAELQAFREAKQMLQEALRAAGFEVDEDITPRLGRSASEVLADSKSNGSPRETRLVDTGDDAGADSDNEVPADLLVAHEDPGEELDRQVTGNHDQQAEDSENEVPADFLAEHGEGNEVD